MIDNKIIAKQLKKSINKLATQKTIVRASIHKNKFKEVKTSHDYSDGILRLLCEILITPGSRDYFKSYVNIDILKREVIEFNCNCRNFQDDLMYKENPKPCDHMVASVYKLIEMMELGSPIFPELSEVTRQMSEKKSSILLKGLSNISEKKKELVNLDLKLTRATNQVYDLSLKIGTNRLYILKNIQDFIMSIDSGKTINFGKQFTFNPEEHYFTEEDQRIIDFIQEYSEISMVLEISQGSRNFGFGYYGGTKKLVKNKEVTIISTALRRLLNLAKHKKITLDYNGEEKRFSIIEGNIPMEFSMKEDENGIHISKNSSLPETMSSNNDVFIYEDKIYIPSKENCEKYLAFIEAFNDGKDATFPKSKSEDIFTKVLPALKSVSKNIEIDKSIEDKIQTGELSLEFYFDRFKDNIWCNVKAVYGDEKFDIIKGYAGEKYLIRNVIKEEDIRTFLENNKFYINKDKFQFTGSEEELFDFLGNGIESFKDLGEVYYSDRFKENKIYKASAISASLFQKDEYLKFSFSMDNVEGKEFNDIIKAFKNKRKFYKLKNNSFVDLGDTGVKDFLTVLDNMLGDKKIKGNEIDINLNRAMYLNDSLGEKNLKFINGKKVIENIAKSFESLDKVDYTVPKNLNAELRDYQVTGFKWLKTISHYGFGGILADEMGLGKTVQTIAFLLSENKKKSLIVTPTSLIYNWKNEFSKFAPTMKILVLHGIKEQRLDQMKDIKNYDVVLTTYGTLRNDFSEYEKLKFDYCIIDEGQNIKNPLSQSSVSVKDIKAKVKIALTGTPVENNLMELWSIFDFIMPGYLYNKTRFKKEFVGRKDEKTIKELKKLIKPFILRRLKKNVIEELPDKIEKKFYVEMSEEQKKVYATFVNDIKGKMEREEETDKITVFSYLTKLRQLCLDPSLLVEGYTGGSPKIDIALEIISENIANGNKVLLFSQFTSVLANIKEALDKNNIGYYYLDGGTKASSRIDLVDSFNNDVEKNVFLISLKAGGTGLNLTSANVVIHFDPWWNPAIEEQATDRAHRIGQKNVVEVIKLISQGTVEEKVITMQESKKELINQVIEGDFKEGSFLNRLSKEEIQGLFQLS